MSDRQSSDSMVPESPRRDVLKAVGAGTALSVLGATARATDDSKKGDGKDGYDDAHREYSVHTVETRIAPTTSEERPADFFYQPTGLYVQPGDVVKWVFVTPDHTVTTYHPIHGMGRRIPERAAPFSSPVLGWDPDSLPDDVTEPPELDGGGNGNGLDPEPDTYLHCFHEKGVYDIECAPHEGYGMAMRIVVGDETETDFETEDAAELPPPRAGPVGASRRTLTDPALAPDRIVDESVVRWQDLDVSALADGGGDAANGNGSENTDSNGTGGNASDGPNGNTTSGDDSG